MKLFSELREAYNEGREKARKDAEEARKYRSGRWKESIAEENDSTESMEDEE